MRQRNRRNSWRQRHYKNTTEEEEQLNRDDDITTVLALPDADPECAPQQVAHSTCGDSEYNLRSRTVVCGSCGLPSDKSSNCSVSSASRSFRSGGLSEGLLPQSYVFSASTPRKVSTAARTGDVRLPFDVKTTCVIIPTLSKCLRRPEPDWRTVQSCEARVQHYVFTAS